MFVLLLLTGGIFALSLFQVLVELAYAILPPFAPPSEKKKKVPFVSIHIAAYNEPPVLLKNTLRAINAMTVSPGETMVLDNNTKDEDVWKPVQAYCETLGSSFIFYHIDPLKGFKAGALDYMRAHTYPRAEYICTIDADYEVEPDFLEKALTYFTDDSIAFVQFPQSYLNVTNRNAGISGEYGYYFQVYMNAGNYLNAAGATGTLTIFRVSALKRVGNYDHSSITEDADIGVRLLKHGLRGVFVNEIVGQGLMPYDLEAYKKQKARWAQGNGKVFASNFLKIFWSRRLAFGQKLSILSSLTAWLNGLLWPTVVILALGALQFFGCIPMGAGRIVLLWAVGTWAVFLVGKFLSFYLALRDVHPFFVVCRAFLVHVGSSWLYATAPLIALYKRQLYYERTNKFILPRMPKLLKNTFAETCVGVSALVLALGFMGVYGLQFWALIMIGVAHLLVYYVQWEIVKTKEASASLLKKRDKRLHN